MTIDIIVILIMTSTNVAIIIGVGLFFEQAIKLRKHTGYKTQALQVNYTNIFRQKSNILPNM